MGPFAGAHLSVNLVNSRDGLDNVRPIRSSSEAHAEAYCHLKSLIIQNRIMWFNHGS